MFDMHLLCRKMFADIAAEHTNRMTVDETAEGMSCLLNYIYAPTVDSVNIDNVHTSLKLARKYDMPYLLCNCESCISTLVLSDSSLPVCIGIAADCQLTDLTERCIEYAAKRLHNIQKIRCSLWCLHVACMPASPKNHCYSVPRSLPSTKCRTDTDKSATDWLEALPTPMVVRLMQKRVVLIAGKIRRFWGGKSYSSLLLDIAVLKNVP